MPFIITKVGSVTLFNKLERGDTQSMGQGRASTDFVQMPGGGHFDNYGELDSPRDPAPITKQGVLYDTGGASIREQVEELRAMLGKRARIEALWHDDETRWTWGRLTMVDTTRNFTAVTNLPCNVTIMPQEGVWYAEEEEVVAETFSGSTMAEDIAIDNPGTVYATDPILEFKAAFNDALEITFENYETSQKVTVGILAIAVDETLIINVGNRTVRLHKLPTTISSIGRSGNTITLTATAHGLSDGDEVVIRGTSYDGFYTVDDAPDANTLTVLADPLVKAPHGPETPVAGLVAEVDDLFGNTDFSDPADWFWLAPGSQTIHITADHDMDGSTVTITYNPTYG